MSDELEVYDELRPEGALTEAGVRVGIFLNARGRREIRYRIDGELADIGDAIIGALELTKQKVARDLFDVWDENEGPP